MRNATLKISSLVLCGLLIYNSLGYFLVLSVMRMAVRHQKWAQLSSLPQNQLTTFVFNTKFTNKQVKIINSREIIVDGNLYDIVRSSNIGSQITYSCVRDHQEENIIAKTRLFNSNAQHMPQQNTARLIIDKIIKTGVTNDPINGFTESCKFLLSCYRLIPYTGPALQISLPPPQAFC